MSAVPTVRIVIASSAEVRLDAARRAIAAHAGDGVLVVASSRAAADELVLGATRAHGALVDVTRMSFAELATKLALPVLADRLASPSGALGIEAMVARATFDATEARDLAYFAPVADLPGFPRAAARTLTELQHAGIAPADLARVDRVGPDLAALARRLAEQTSRAGAISRADVIATAAARLGAQPDVLPSRHVLLLDVAVATAAERALQIGRAHV